MRKLKLRVKSRLSAELLSTRRRVLCSGVSKKGQKKKKIAVGEGEKVFRLSKLLLSSFERALSF